MTRFRRSTLASDGSRLHRRDVISLILRQMLWTLALLGRVPI